MPRGTHPNSLANLKKGKKTQFSGETAVKAQEKSAEAQRQKKPIRELAKLVGETKVNNPKLIKQLSGLGVPEDEITNNALVLAAVFQAAIHGDMKAIEKWEKYIGQFEDKAEDDGGKVEIVIDV